MLGVLITIIFDLYKYLLDCILYFTKKLDVKAEIQLTYHLLFNKQIEEIANELIQS